MSAVLFFFPISHYLQFAIICNIFWQILFAFFSLIFRFDFVLEAQLCTSLPNKKAPASQPVKLFTGADFYFRDPFRSPC